MDEFCDNSEQYGYKQSFLMIFEYVEEDQHVLLLNPPTPPHGSTQGTNTKEIHAIRILMKIGTRF